MPFTHRFDKPPIFLQQTMTNQTPEIPPAPPTPPFPSGNQQNQGNQPLASVMKTSQWAIIFHLSGFLGLIAPIPLVNILAPLVLWLMKKADSPELDAVGKEVLNFQISYFIYTIALGVIGSILTIILVGFLLYLLIPVVVVAWIVLMIIAAVKTSNGEAYRYPLTIRFLA